MAIDWWVIVNVSVMEMTSNASAGVLGEVTGVKTSIKKHSLLLQDSSSESETEGTTKGEGAANEILDYSNTNT